VSNHVIEHVGPRPIQMDHLREIHRVLRPSGLLYLAAPNKWTVMEPHFRLPFLSWLPHPMADRYVRMAGRGSHYDCWPAGAGALPAMLTESGFFARNLCPQAVKRTLRERSASIIRNGVLYAPDRLLRAATPLMPSLIYAAHPIPQATLASP
jgi:SAM-dependent methyltransferase